MTEQDKSVFKKIIVGFDGSSQSERAADLAIDLAQPLEAKILLLAVAQLPEPATSVEVEGVLDNAKEHFTEAFSRVQATAKSAGIDLNTDIVAGHPAEQIIHRAEVDKADLIILGRRGRSTFTKWMLGSISEKVLRYAHCPVMVLR